MMRTALLIGATVLSTAALAQDVSVGEGERVSVIGGCHDCHTVGYDQSGGAIDPAVALKGNPIGYGGPWGVNYAVNIRLEAADKTEDQWVSYLSTLKAGPPMPWYNVHKFTEAEMRSLYQYVKSLGEPGEPAPEDVKPGGVAKTPFVVMAPPQMPG